MVNVSTHVRHMIDVHVEVATSDELQYTEVIMFEFTTRDIGLTQGTTIITHDGQIVFQYRPGTRHWKNALDCTVELLQKAAQCTVAGGTGWDMEVFKNQLAQVAHEAGGLFWSGEDLDPGFPEEWQ